MAGRTKSGTLPFIGVSEGFDLVKKVWGVTGLPTLPTPASMAQFATRLPQTLPSMIAPTLDVEELDKRIADLRAVEQWLNLNLSMLRTTVQSLEVQRNTIATLKSFGGAMLSSAAASPPAPENWPYTAAGQPFAPAGQPVLPVPPPAAAAPTAPPTRRRRSARAAAAAATLPLNPTAWWNTLQEQFNKIAVAAAEEAAASAKAAAERSSEPQAPAKKAPPETARSPRKAAKPHRKPRRTPPHG